MRLDGMGEADVREEVLAPLVARLGYSNREGSGTRVLREHRLEYDRLSLGRRKKGDPVLVGIADYTLEVSGHARWTLEAKAPDVALDEQVVSQAWSYAAHPEVRGVYFAVSNGREFQLFVTSASPSDAPLFSCRDDELVERFAELAALLAPAAIVRRFPNYLLRMGRPLCPGLLSMHHVVGGSISYRWSSHDEPMLSKLKIAISDGAVFRNADGRIEVEIVTAAPFTNLDESLVARGLERQTYVSNDDVFSIDPNKPTRLVMRREHPLDIGFDAATLEVVSLSTSVKLEAKAACVASNGRLKGDFRMRAEISVAGRSTTVEGAGTLELRLA